jgi:hypothetical protein
MAAAPLLPAFKSAGRFPALGVRSFGCVPVNRLPRLRARICTMMDLRRDLVAIPIAVGDTGVALADMTARFVPPKLHPVVASPFDRASIGPPLLADVAPDVTDVSTRIAPCITSNVAAYGFANDAASPGPHRTVIIARIINNHTGYQ